VHFRSLGLALITLAATIPSRPHAEEADPGRLGLPALEVPADNPITKEKVRLGERLFNDQRFSSTKKISCASCHDAKLGFATHLKVAVGINGLKGTRNSPTVENAAFNQLQFWDGRSPSLEDQALHPFVNPVEMGLADHEPILKTIRDDKDYREAFKQVFNLTPEKIGIQHVTMAIAAFERTLIDGGSRFDRWYYNGEKTLNASEIRGFQVFVGNGRCVSCHMVEQTSALFTDHKFHNIGVGINRVPQADIDRLTQEYLRAQYSHETVDKKVLTDTKSSELGRFAVTRQIPDMGAFKTPTLRNIALTAPYMHDGSLKTLDDVVEHYNRGGASSDKEKINPYLSGGIRPLNLTGQEKRDLVAFMRALTSAKHLAKNRR
jgi:cytochrome c peroxidase